MTTESLTPPGVFDPTDPIFRRQMPAEQISALIELGIVDAGVEEVQQTQQGEFSRISFTRASGDSIDSRDYTTYATKDIGLIPDSFTLPDAIDLKDASISPEEYPETGWEPQTYYLKSTLKQGVKPEPIVIHDTNNLRILLNVYQDIKLEPIVPELSDSQKMADHHLAVCLEKLSEKPIRECLDRLGVEHQTAISRISEIYKQTSGRGLSIAENVEAKFLSSFVFKEMIRINNQNGLGINLADLCR